MTKNPVSLKQSEGLVTNWLHRLRTDLFFRTEVLVIGTFFLLCIINVAIIIFSLQQFHIDVASSVISILSGAIALNPSSANSTTTTALILESVREISLTNVTIVVASSLMVAVILGFLAARIALTPTKQALSAQKQFISNISHELRTPLSIIRANSEILLLQKGARPDAQELIRSNVEELDRISGIINNLLTLNTFRHAQAIEFKSIELSEIVRESIKKLETLAGSKEIELDASLDDTLIVWGNRNGLAQIIMNLIKNALIYTPTHGSVIISTYASHRFATLEVRDTGIGIEAGNIQKVFEPFYQVEPSRSQNKGSGGLGLAIVSELVKFHHGKISIRSTPGIGTVIRVDFPLHHPDRPHHEKNSSDDDHEITLDFSKHPA
jgi:signal transduction histidine kinase